MTVYCICPVTGGLFDHDDGVTQVLPDCESRTVSPEAGDDMTVCARRGCSHVFDASDGVTVEDEEWCPSCADAHAVVSDRSGDYICSDNAVSVTIYPYEEEETWSQSEAENHADRCDHCNRWVYHRTRANLREVGVESWCPSCIDSEASTCDACDALCPSDDMMPDEDGEGSYCCEQCLPEDSGIGSYHSSCERGFRPAGAGPCYFGIEVEAVAKSDRRATVRGVRESWGSAIAGIERDGSLPDATGFEVVTHPHSLAAWRAFFAAEDRDIADALSHDTDCCGLHVHVTRAAFSDLTWAKVAIFLHDSKNEPTLSRVFRRSPNTYCERGGVTGAVSAVWQSKPGYSPRYRVVNFEGHRTVEFRWPRGTTKADTILATIEAVDSLVRYCAQRPVSDVGSVSTWIAWIRAPQQAHYRSLRDYLVRRGVMSAYKTTPRAAPRTEVQPCV